MPLVAGVDSSTQSTKVVLCDADTGAHAGAGAAAHPATAPPSSEQDPAAWWEALVTAWGRALASAGASGKDVRAISIAAQCHGLVALDGAGRVIRPAKLWNDTTSAPEMRALLEALPAAEWARRTGSVPTAAFTVSKLLWLKNHEPENYSRLAHVLLPHDWLTYRLTGRMTTDRSEASGTGYYNAEAGEYDLRILAAVDPGAAWGDRLPAVLGPTQPAGAVTAAAADALGVRPGTLVGPGAGDQHAGALGLGVRPGGRVISLGTSGVVYAVSATPTHDERGIVNGVADAAGGYLPLVCTLNAARVTDTFAHILGVDHSELSRLALAARGAGTPVLAAFLDGERTPDLPLSTGTLAGLRTDTTREQVARAAVEGVIFGLKRGAGHLDRVGVPFSGPLVATGGAARSPAYLQLAADAFGSAVHISASSESVAAGAAVQAAAVAAGAAVQDVRDAWIPQPESAAEPGDTASSDDAYRRYLAAAQWRGGDR